MPIVRSTLGNTNSKKEKPAKRVYARDEVRIHRALIERLYRDGASPQETKRILEKGVAGPGETIPPMKLSLPYIKRMRDRICDEWLKQDEVDTRSSKAAQVRRLYQLRAQAAGTKKVRDVVLVEQELAKLMGHYAPIKVEAEVLQTQALKLVIGGLSDKDLEEHHQAALRMLGGKQLPIIDVEAEEVSSAPKKRRSGHFGG